MASIFTDLRNFWSIRNTLRSSFNRNPSLLNDYQWLNGKPAWVSLKDPNDFEKASRFNPIVKAAINLLATSSSNGKKIAVDINTGETIPWTEKDQAIQKAYQLLVKRPNPLQSAKEFQFQGTFYHSVFGNRYVRPVLPIGYDKIIDLLHVQALYNLPSQFVKVKDTGKLFDQTEISGIIEKYALTNYDPIKEYLPELILHFNEVNISSDMPTIMGISKLEVLQMPITNTQKAFEAMNTLLTSRGMQGIISPKGNDALGPVSLTPDEKKDIDDKFKQDYGLLNKQNPFLLTPVPLDYIKTVMSASELGIYSEFSNNAMIISNEFGIPPELIKTYIQGATYENQVQSVRRLYQDTTIPKVDEEDNYWSYRLGTDKYGFEIQTTWNHIPALQDAFKEKASALSLNGRTAETAYNNNVITLNQYLLMLDKPIVDDGDVYKYERDKKTQENEKTN